MAGVAAFVLWGLLPAYWKGLQDFDPLLVVAQARSRTLSRTRASLIVRAATGVVLCFQDR